ncbi:MAG TPA: amidohydrolase family protein [Micropepsaceae bacterium]|nr:amidohydrolase family protein [Micropepsaceae bacterium]
MPNSFTRRAVFGCIAALGFTLAPAAAQQQATLYEGARLITGDGTPAIENSAFLVKNGAFVRVGRKGEIPLPAGGNRVDLTGKTVMPTLVDMHGHFGFQNLIAGTMSKDMFTRENLIDHMQRLAYVGVGAVVGVGDLADRSDLHGGRTHWSNAAIDLRDHPEPGAALFKTAGPGIAWPGSGAQGDPSRVDVAYPVTTVAEARAAVDDYVKMKPEFIKIWVDDRSGTKKTLTPELYGAILDEAHKFNVPVGVHNVTLANAKQMVKDGMEGWLHVPVRGGDVVDDEMVRLVKDRIARNDRPHMWVTPALITAWMDTAGGPQRPNWLDDPLLKALYSPQQIEQYWGAPLRKMTPADVAKAKASFAADGKNMMVLRAAGMTVVGGTDTGQKRHLVAFQNHLDLESMVAMGLTPMEAIKAATSDGAAAGHFNTGLIAAGRNADFIVLNANPVDSISNTRKIAQVYLRGAEVPRAQYAAKWAAELKTASAK